MNRNKDSYHFPSATSPKNSFHRESNGHHVPSKLVSLLQSWLHPFLGGKNLGACGSPWSSTWGLDQRGASQWASLPQVHNGRGRPVLYCGLRGSLLWARFLYLGAGQNTDLGFYAKEFVLISSGCYTKNTIGRGLNNKHLFLIVLENWEVQNQGTSKYDVCWGPSL